MIADNISKIRKTLAIPVWLKQVVWKYMGIGFFLFFLRGIGNNFYFVKNSKTTLPILKKVVPTEIPPTPLCACIIAQYVFT